MNTTNLNQDNTEASRRPFDLPATTDRRQPVLPLGVDRLLAGVDPGLVERINREMRQTYQQGEILCREGDAADHLYVILRGAASVSIGGENIATRTAGETVGEQAFIDRTGRSASVTAVSQVDAFRIPHPVAEQLLENPAFTRNLLSVLSGKLSEATRDRGIRYRRERLLFAEFRAHVSEEVAQRLLNSGLDYGLPRRVPAVVLFSDIRNFTSTSAAMFPEDVAAQLTAYFDRVVDVVHSHGGVVDKFIGDGMMAVWGGFEPLSPEEMVARSFACAKSMVRTAGTMCFGGAPVAIGVGLNFGEVFLGNVGGEGKRQFTVLGNTVNLAARFESQSKELAAPIIVGPAFAAVLTEGQRLGLASHPEIRVNGAAPQTLYTWSPANAREEDKGP